LGERRDEGFTCLVEGKGGVMDLDGFESKKKLWRLLLVDWTHIHIPISICDPLFKLGKYNMHMTL